MEEYKLNSFRIVKIHFHKNYVLIDELNISFSSGFSVITGETGQ